MRMFTISFITILIITLSYKGIEHTEFKYSYEKDKNDMIKESYYTIKEQNIVLSNSLYQMITKLDSIKKVRPNSLTNKEYTELRLIPDREITKKVINEKNKE